MKRILLVIALVLLSFKAYAIERDFSSVTSTGTTKKTTLSDNGESNFERVGASGNQVAGNAGTYAFMACDAGGSCFPYYIWIDGSNGNLCTASYPTISNYASFPSGDWRTGMPCTKVGSQ